MARSEKAQQTSMRNHKIMRLRGAYKLFKELNSLVGMNEVDYLLKQLGAMPETNKQEYLREQRRREYEKLKAEFDPEIPF